MHAVFYCKVIFDCQTPEIKLNKKTVLHISYKIWKSIKMICIGWHDKVNIFLNVNKDNKGLPYVKKIICMPFIYNI